MEIELKKKLLENFYQQGKIRNYENYYKLKYFALNLNIED